MKPMERFAAVLAGDTVDRCPVSLTLSLYGARFVGGSLREYYTNAARYAEGQTAVVEAFAPDILFSPFSLPLEGSAWGSEVRFFDHQPPNLVRPAVSSAEELLRIAPPDVNVHPQLGFFREAIRRMAQAHGTDVPIAGVALNPMELPAMLLGIEGWLNALLFDEARAREILKITTAFCVRWMNALFSEGATFIVTPTNFTNPSIVTRAIVEEIAVPALTETFQQLDGPVVVHSGGSPLSRFLDAFASLPQVGGFVLNANESFAEAREKIGAQAVLVGNIDGPSLGTHTPDAIRSQCRALLEDRRDDAHFILGTSGADVALATPPECIRALKHAAQAFAEEADV